MADTMRDEEKGHRAAPAVESVSSPSETGKEMASFPSSGNAWTRLNARIQSIKFLESRGIERVPESERHAASASNYMQMALLWFSTNITANNIAIGMYGPLDYSLSFVDSALCAVFGAFLGAAGVAYMGTFGPQSGNRTMVVARYFMGYYPSKIACLLNIIIMLGYGMIDCLVGGQVLSAVADGGLTVVVGIIIIAIITWIVVVFGMAPFHVYERWAWVPQLIAIFVLVGSAGPKFDTNIKTTGDPQTVNANRLTFFSLCLSSSIAWAPAGADFFVYFPPTTSKWKTFTLTLFGVGLALSFANLMGVGLASGTLTNPSWAEAYDTSAGALIIAGYDGLGGFGKFLGVLVALGLIANNIPGTYSATLGFQIMGRHLGSLPRWFLSCVCVIIYTACALGGRNHLYDIFENFLALMGYWVTIYLTIALEEHLIFRRTRGFDWDAWADRSKLPLGLAALTAFLIGWAGAIVCMDQIWYVGPIARMVGSDGADLGIWVGVSWAMLVFPPLRWLELQKIGR
ncbi:purine-cytosine permease family protein [Aspergillus vadensis CBS 113365]|uniref:Vitamin B6 transporter n=1 Tax=Aspergillus vadensis (strain CBS 113365 / IMI 142717 / IBT 24658) TaxID=1448311 RepID=A0A319BSN3_ASPVC|nr:vitamin B6 transporter [Aspergillus vadensis CBS 113365]PYH68863.1 vitamin B6 transporter [Aspergillus vadensis CBS 113365]